MARNAWDDFFTIARYAFIASLAHQAASGAVNLTTSAIRDLRKAPDVVKCPTCTMDVGVPPSAFRWECQTVTCREKKISHPLSTQYCNSCYVTPSREVSGFQPAVVCMNCQTYIPLSSSTAGQNLRTVQRQTQKAGSAVSRFGKEKYDEITAVPTIVKCSDCDTPLDIPERMYDWKCVTETCKLNNQWMNWNSECIECKSKKPEQKECSVSCAKCQKITVVPFTKFQLKIKEATQASKKMVIKAGSLVTEPFVYLKNKPVQFNCQTCSSQLQAPAEWTCKACTLINDRKTNRCQACETPQNEDPIACSVCLQTTPIPASNFSKHWNTSTQFLQKWGQKMYYTVSNKPYMRCDRCQENIPLPESTGETEEVKEVKRTPTSSSSSSSSSSSLSSSASSSPSPSPSEIEPEWEYLEPGAPHPSTSVSTGAASVNRLECPKCHKVFEPTK